MIEVDDVDHTIMKLIRNNSRLSTRGIARKSGIPIATVNRRMKKLIRTGVIKKFTTEFDYEKIGRKLVSYVLIRTKPGADYYDVYDAAVQHDSVEDIASITGQFDILIKVHVKDSDELSDFIFKQVRNFPSVAQTETLLSLKVPPKQKK